MLETEPEGEDKWEQHGPRCMAGMYVQRWMQKGAGTAGSQVAATDTQVSCFLTPT
jgi:hypothetical protein